MIFFDNILFLLPSFTEEQSVLSSKLPKVAILASSAVLWLEERPVHESSEGATLTQLVRRRCFHQITVFTDARFAFDSQLYHSSCSVLNALDDLICTFWRLIWNSKSCTTEDCI